MALMMGVMMLTSCNKDKENSKEAVFTANIEQHTGQQGRTAINPENGQVKWLAGDKIVIANGEGEGETAQFTLQSGAGTTEGTFRTTGEFEMDAPFTAVYPQTATLNGTTATFTLPATQTLTETGTFANGANPMAAYGTDENLYFKNLCGGLDVRLLGDNIHVSGIRITGNESEKLNGTFAVDCSANEPAIMASQGTNGTNVVTLNCDAVLDAETATEFFIVLPVGALAQGFTMEVLDGTEVICTKQLETNLAQIVRNEVKRFNPLLIGETPTPIELPDVVTNQVTDITTTAATVGGEIVSDGGSAITECGVCYKTGNEDWTCVNLTATNNAFSTTLTELTPNTTYTVRAYATNEEGTGYGEEVTFTTEEETPEPPVGPVGIIDGAFTINANGQQVYFSQGNLQYQASTNTWQFAEQQYDYVGNANNAISQTNSGWIDLFGWGTSGYNHGANAYQPWSTSTNYSDYYAYGNWEYNLYDQTGQADWGYNAISNGGNAENSGWRTLTQPEWDYVFNTRSTASGIRYAKAKVNNVNGVILLPDNWDASVYALSNTNNAWGGFVNTITAEDWANTLEANGAVFLPAAGYRGGTSVNDVGSVGNYWSSTYYNSSYAYFVYFYSGNLHASNNTYRDIGLSVRLVRLAE